MKIVRNAFLIAGLSLFAFTATACNKGAKEAEKLGDLADKICACSDKECVEKEFDPFVEYVKKLQEDNAKGTQENIDKAGEAAEKAVNCYQKNGGDPAKILELANAVQ